MRSSDRGGIIDGTASHREAKGLGRWLDAIARDVRFGIRSLRGRPGFAVATIATMGFGIAAAVTAFGFIDSVFLRPLPVPRADHLVRVYFARSGAPPDWIGSRGAAVLRAHPELFQQVAEDNDHNVRFVRARGTLEQRFIAFVSPEFWPMLGLSAQRGRVFGPRDDAVAVISASLWHARFQSDPGIIGETMAVDGHDVTVIGVAPEGFEGIAVGEMPSQIWLPASMKAVIDDPCKPAAPCSDTDVLARLADGVPRSRVASAVSSLAPQLSAAAFADDSVRRVFVRDATGLVARTREELGPLAQLLSAISVVLLLVACANLAGLLLARGVSRRREMALRAAIGASRGRILQQLLWENAIIGVSGSIAGVVLSLWTTRALMGVFMSDEEGFQHFFALGLDARVLGFAVAASLGATALFGILPAVAGARSHPADVLKNTSGVAPGGQTRFGLIAAQIALTTVLLSGAALLARSFGHLLHAQRFDATNVALIRFRPQSAGYDSLQSHVVVRAVRDRLATLPGVESVAFSRGLGMAWSRTPSHVGLGAVPGDSTLSVEAHAISPAFFQALRISILRGREFTEADGPSTAPVAVVSQSVADRLWPHADPIGREAYVHGRAFRVIGVVPDYQVQIADGGVPLMVFVPFWQHALFPEGDVRFVVRLRSDAERMLPPLRRAAAEVDPRVPVTEVMTMAAQIDARFPQIHVGQTVLIAASALALTLSAIGLYGMIAFIVARRTREIGVRVALGARPARVVAEFMRQGMRATSVGVLAGIGVSVLCSGFLRAWLVGIAPRDAVALAIASGSVVAVALVATLVPASRASRIDPVVALRAE